MLEGDEEAKILAGGHSLIPLLKLRLVQPSQLVDIARLPGLSYVREDNGAIAVGAMTTHFDVERSGLLMDALPLLPLTAATIGDVQVRNRGTIGGSLAHADPAADLGAAALALGAEFVAEGPAGRRAIPAQAFFVDVLTTALEPAEVVVEIRFPKPAGRVGADYLKFNHRAIDWAIVGIASWLVFDGDVVSDAAVGLTALGSTPLRATGVEQLLRGQKWSRDLAQAAAQRASDGLDPLSDRHGSAAYRLHLARVLTERSLIAAAARAGQQ